MSQSAKQTLGHSLEPLCPRDDHAMKFEGKGISWKGDDDDEEPQTLPSYHCNYEGCSVRYEPSDGYFTVVLTPDQPFFVEEPGVNLFRCPEHGTWLYRAENRDGGAHFRWRCGVDGCDYARADSERR